MLRHLRNGSSMRPVLLQITQEPLVLHALDEVLQVIDDVRVEAYIEGWGSFDWEGRDGARLVLIQFLFKVLVIVQLSERIDITEYELVLLPALFFERLHHHLIEWLGIHGFEDLILHVACWLPQARRNVHLAHAIPVDIETLQM